MRNKKMKLIIDNENNIIFKVPYEQTTSILLKRLLDKKINDLFNMSINEIPSSLMMFKLALCDIEYITGFDIEIRNNYIYIYGDNGVIEYEIIDLKNIEKL